MVPRADEGPESLHALTSWRFSGLPHSSSTTTSSHWSTINLQRTWTPCEHNWHHHCHGECLDHAANCAWHQHFTPEHSDAAISWCWMYVCWSPRDPPSPPCWSQQPMVSHCWAPSDSSGTRWCSALDLSLCHPICQGGPCIRQDHIRLVRSSPNLLIIKIDIGIWKCIVVTGRAPHSGRPRHEAVAYWAAITADLQRKAADWPILYCGDANAHVGECTTAAVGDLAPAHENQAGEVFHEWLLTNGLKIPATFAELHPGQVHHTYHSPDGHHSTRIDYIAIPQEIEYVRVHSWVSEDISVSIHRTDHLAVLCRCVFEVYAKQPRKRAQHIKWDSHHLGQQLQFEETHHELHSAIHLAPWSLDPHATAANLAEQTTTALSGITQPRKFWKRKCHITEETWALVADKKFLFKQLRQLRRTLRYTVLQSCFVAWRSSATTRPTTANDWYQTLCNDLPSWLHLHDQATAQTLRQYQLAAAKVCKAVQYEDATYYDNLAKQSANTFSVEGLTGIWKHFRAILPKNKGKRNSIQHDLGADLLKHFQELEAGNTSDLGQLQRLCIQRNNQETTLRPAVQQLDLSELPTLVEIEDHCLKQRPHKATGPDGIPSILCRSGAAAIGPQLHALVCKSFLLGVEPFQHKGGHLCALFKHKGARDDAAAYRGILLADSFAKVTHSWTRSKLLPTLQERRTIGQLGGLPSQQTLSGIQILRLHGSVSKAAQLSTCTLFLDLRAAFHHLLRELVFLTSDGLIDRDLEHILDPDHFDIAAIAAKFEQFCPSDRCDIPPGLRQFLHDIHHQTWFQLREMADADPEHCTNTRRGSRPGSPLADIAFNLMMSDLLQELHTALLDMEAYIEGNAALGVTVPPVAWMDDVAIPLTTTTPEALVPLVQHVMAVVHGLFRARGLTLNLDSGKTEAVLCFRGPGADSHRLQMFDKDKRPVIVIETSSHILSLRVVPSYKHLGSLYTMGVDVHREIKARIGAARQAFEEMRKPIFANRKLPISARLQLFQSLILSRLLYGCAVWTDVPQALVKKLESTIIQYYRRIYDEGFWNQSQLTDDEFRRSQRLPSFRQFWAQHKLVYLQHVAQHGKVFHKALLLRELQAERGWLFEIQHDLDWLHTIRPLPFALPQDRQSWFQAWECLRDCKPWKSWIRKAGAKHLMQEKLAWEVSTYHASIVSELQAAGLHFVAQDQKEPESKIYSCPQCSASFKTRQQCALHEFRMHNAIAEERYYVQSTVCSGCLKDFHTTFRVTQHLRYRPNLCWDRICHVKPRDVPVTIALPEHLQGVCRLPAVRRHHGPLRPTSHHRERQQVRLAMQRLQEEGENDFAWWEPDPTTELVRSCFDRFAQCLHVWTAHPTEIDFHNDFFNLLLNMDMPEFQAARVFIFWIETDFQDLHAAMDPDIYEVLEQSHMSLLEGLHIWHLRAQKKVLQQRWERLEKGDPVLPKPKGAIPVPHDRRHPIASTYKQLPVDEADRKLWVVMQNPKINANLGKGPYYVVHLYSGRRRDGDFHHYMQELLDAGPQQISQSVLVISIDTAIDEQKMNVHDAKLWTFLLEAARQGQLLAVLLGPPCETWSSARFEQQLDAAGLQIRGPRPLRGAPNDCWGLLALSLRELQQVSVGNCLLLKGLQLCVCTAMGGGAVALEHPAPPLQQERPSIWRTAIVRLLCGYGMPFRQYTFQQWRHGALGVKPTTLLYANVAIPQIFAANEQNHLERPTTHLIGRAADGSYRTAIAKEYPPGMNRSFAESFWQRIQFRFQRQGFFDRTAEFPQLAKELAQTSALIMQGQRVMPDYQPV